MKESRLEKGIKTIAKEGRADRASRVEAADKLAGSALKLAQASYIRSQARSLKKQAKASIIEAKANKIKAKQGAAKIRAISSGAVGVAAAVSGNKSSQNAANAMAEWAKAINSSSTAAEGTGEPKGGNTSTSDTTGSDQGDPYGNYRHEVR